MARPPSRSAGCTRPDRLPHRLLCELLPPPALAASEPRGHAAIVASAAPKPEPSHCRVPHIPPMLAPTTQHKTPLLPCALAPVVRLPWPLPIQLESLPNNHRRTPSRFRAVWSGYVMPSFGHAELHTDRACRPTLRSARTLSSRAAGLALRHDAERAWRPDQTVRPMAAAVAGYPSSLPSRRTVRQLAQKEWPPPPANCGVRERADRPGGAARLRHHPRREPASFD